MNSSLYDSAVQSVLDRLHDAAEREDPSILSRVHQAAPGRAAHDDAAVASLLAEAYIPVSRETGRLLYLLARAADAGAVVEFGTSFGISAIYLAAALRDRGAGKLITAELNPRKAERARRNLDEAGLGAFVEIRQGDALETLRGLDAPVELLFLDGWKNLYLPVLKLVEPALGARAVVVADDLDIYPEAHKPFLEYIRNPASGYVSVSVPLGDRLEVAVRA